MSVEKGRPYFLIQARGIKKLGEVEEDYAELKRQAVHQKWFYFNLIIYKGIRKEILINIKLLSKEVQKQ